MGKLQQKSTGFAIGLLGIAASFTFGTAVQAALTISPAPTANVTCGAGVCTAVAADAVLNVGDLGNMLAVAALRISSGSDAQDIVFAAPFSWGSSNALSLDAYRSIQIDRSVADNGPGSLTLTTNDGGIGGFLAFGARGRITFKGRANTLQIDGRPYWLVGSIAELAAAIAADPMGAFALARSYDASADGSYSRAPIPTEFGGIFEGLGNVISNFSLYDTTDNNVALFAAVNERGTLRNVSLLNANMLSENSFVQFVAPLAAYNAGVILQCQTTGAVRSDFWMTGGGLVALNYGTIQRSFASVEVSGAQNATVGGLVGNSHGALIDVYSTGRVIAGDNSDVGGLVGYFIGSRISRAYAAGDVSGGQNARVGGLMGENRIDVTNGKVLASYWDTILSGTTTGVGYGSTSGITGQGLTFGLPSGLTRSIWSEKKRFNAGLPFLKANPPRQPAG